MLIVLWCIVCFNDCSCVIYYFVMHCLLFAICLCLVTWCVLFWRCLVYICMFLWIYLFRFRRFAYWCYICWITCSFLCWDCFYIFIWVWVLILCLIFCALASLDFVWVWISLVVFIICFRFKYSLRSRCLGLLIVCLNCFDFGFACCNSTFVGFDCVVLLAWFISLVSGWVVSLVVLMGFFLFC